MKSFNLLAAFLLVFASSFLSVQSIAQPGTIDPTFNPTDLGFGDGPNGVPNLPLLQPDGKIFITAGFTSYSGVSRNSIARLNADGSLDLSFNPGTGASSIVTAGLQADGKLVVGGFFSSYNGTNITRVARLNSDGSLDGTFNPGAGPNGLVRWVLVQPDGKIIITGDFTTYDGTSRNRIARLNANGTLDTAFDPGTAGNDAVFNAILQPDGKLIISGIFTAFNGVGYNRIARLNTDGSIDGLFNIGTGFNQSVYATALQPDGKILVGGEFNSFNGVGTNRIARLNADGSLDGTFNIGTGASGYVASIALESDGRLLIVGGFNQFNSQSRPFIARLNADGSLAPGLGSGADSNLNYVTLQPNGKIFITGNFTAFNGIDRMRITRLNPDGTPDASFMIGTGASNQVNAIARQGNGKLLLTGVFTHYNGAARGRIVRTDENGVLDATFNPGTGANNAINAIAMQADGKIIIGGSFNLFNGQGFSRIARLNADGSLDFDFDIGSGANGPVNSILVQPDGKIIIAGLFAAYRSTSRIRIARINTDGTVDATFNPGTSGNNAILASALQPDGKVIVAGAFGSFGGVSRPRIARLNADGSVDLSFGPGTGADDRVFAVALQPDGKLIIGGWFTTYGGSARNGIARLNSDGTLDTSFDPGTGATQVQSIALQPDGKIIIGGSFSFYNGIERSSIARINSDGSLDATFAPGTGADAAGQILALTGLPDGKVLIGGSFTSYNGTGRNRVARIMGDAPPPPPPPVYVTAPANNTVNIPTNPTVSSIVLPGSSSYTIELSETINFAVVAFTKTGGNTLSFSGLKYNTKYYNRVKTNTTEGYGEVRNFTTMPASNLTVVTAPVNGAVNVPTVVSLSSNLVPGAASYTIELSETNDFSVVAFSSTGTTPVRPFYGLKYNQQYFNRVTTDLSEGAFGQVRSFTTMPATNLTVVTAPANGAVNVPTVVSLSTNLVVGAASYTIELSETNDFAVVAFTSTGATPVRPFYGLKYNQQYFNRVTTDVSGGAFGQVRSFTTMSAANLTVVTAPANGAVNVPTVVSLSTNLVVGAASYTIELSETNDFAVVAFTSTGATPVRPFFGLKYNQQYFNRVTTDVSGGAFGQVRSFTTQPATSVAFVASPANGAVNVPTVASIVSNFVPGATSYTIELSETNDFAVVAFSSTGSSPVRPFFGLKYNQQYFNRVTTDLSAGTFGQVKSFTTQPASNVAFVSTPANGATGVSTTVFVVSNLVPGAGSYTIELSTTSNFSVVNFSQTGPGPVLMFSGLSVSTTYFNRVLTDISGGVYGAVKSFTTKSTPGGRMAFPEVVTAVEDERADFELKLYSNPFRDRLVVVVESKLADQAELNLMDMNGRIVHASLAKTNTEIEIGHSLSSGIYLLRANTGTNIKTIRVVKLE